MTLTRSSRLNLNYANKGKQEQLRLLGAEALRVINLYIDQLWNPDKPVTTKFVKTKVETWLSARMQQALGKQALQIMRSQRKRKVKTKPQAVNCSLDLDQRFITLDLNSELTEFDLVITLGSLGNKLRLVLPTKKHKQLNDLINDDWNLKPFGRLIIKPEELWLEVVFTKDVTLRAQGNTLGIDVGYNKVLATSNQQFLGTQLKSKAEKISRKQQGSKAFKRSLVERNDYINQTIKALDLTDVKQVIIEDLKNVKHKSKQKRKVSTAVMNKLQRWVYSRILTKLEQHLEVVGVQCLKVNPAYTSQTCNKCLQVAENSRRGNIFKCTSCGYEADADYNASLNILRWGLGEYGP